MYQVPNYHLRMADIFPPDNFPPVIFDIVGHFPTVYFLMMTFSPYITKLFKTYYNYHNIYYFPTHIQNVFKISLNIWMFIETQSNLVAIIKLLNIQTGMGGMVEYIKRLKNMC